MGCSKRICEIYVQSLDKAIKEGKLKGITQFVTTRFGNVLGSNGSVIPLFERQIKAGGPVTVTDEHIIRFFMLIPEACKLVLEAGTHGKGGERRRTEIARCLAIDPKFIMLDEPFAGVDPIAVEDIQHIVWRLKYRNIGILITDHNVQETLTITDRAYLLFEGRILFKGNPEELAANKIVREKYLSNSFVLRKKDFQTLDEERRAREAVD